MNLPWNMGRFYGRFIDPELFATQSLWRDPIQLLRQMGELPEISWVKIEKPEKPVYWLPDTIEDLPNTGPTAFDLPIDDEGLPLLFLSVVLNGEADPLPSNLVSFVINAEVGDVEPIEGVLGSSFWWLNSTKDHPNLAYLYTTE